MDKLKSTISNDFHSSKMSESDFKVLSEFIYKEYGIKMPPSKKILLESRLQKRLKANHIDTFKEYCEYVFSEKGNETEIVHMIDVVSTNKTDFFRELAHFEYMNEVLLPSFTSQNSNEIKIWSSACSSGEEPYTIAMVMSEYNLQHSPINFHILGTDISSAVLHKAENAIYAEDRIKEIPHSILRKYFLKSKDLTKPTVRVVSEIRKKVAFCRLNLMADNYPISESFDIIFCRNVLIYFDRITQEKVIGKLCEKLKPNGTFFLGHSESLLGMDLPLKNIKPTIFKKI
ncbi:MAG: chemotaxis protein CheR [Bacteroidetes bacterium RIFCSPLOWO2_12_FULL_35_15]|nr:MAG: chemotaxis protein CheR [Bacteroidetes bacterium RIFCSPLOWO2_12_FULL_35_15]